MCGRSGLSLDKENVRCACSYRPKNSNLYVKPEWLPEHNDGKDYVPSYNVAPTDVTPVLISGSRFRNNAKTDRVLKPMMWGIIPPWHKGDYKTHKLSTNNCRIECIKSSKLYGPILQNGGRCIIIVEGFYEWQTTNKTAKVKQPYYIYTQQDDGVKVDEPQTWTNKFDEENGWKGINLLHMAGLYNEWQFNDTIIYSYTVITMESNSTLDWLHHRMPAILDTQQQIQIVFCERGVRWPVERAQRLLSCSVHFPPDTMFKAWLDIDSVNPDVALSMLTPIKMVSWHPVSTFVNNSRNKSADCNKRQSDNKNSLCRIRMH